MRPDGRRPDQLRPLEIIPGFQKHAEGSALVKLGDTWVLCAASVENGVPPFLTGKNQGWLTAEYAMLPRSTHTRSKRDPGFPEVDDQTECQVSRDETEEHFSKGGPPSEAHQRECEDKQERRLIESRRMPSHSVAEVDRPRHRRWQSVGAIRQPAQETANAPDCAAQGDWDGEQIAGRLVDVQPPLLPLDRNPSADEASDDCLPTGQILQVRQLRHRSLRILEPEQDAAAEDGANNRRRGERPPRLGGYSIATGASLLPVRDTGNGVCQ